MATGDQAPMLEMRFLINLAVGLDSHNTILLLTQEDDLWITTPFRGVKIPLSNHCLLSDVRVML